MRQYILILFFFCISIHAVGQENLVKNPGFESNSYKKQGVIEIHPDAKQAYHWNSPSYNNPDLFVNPKRSVATANSGRSAVGLVLGGARHEKVKYQYLTGELETPLVKGQIYCVCFSTILQRNSRWAATDVGILFHRDRNVIAKISEPTTLTASLYVNDGKPVTATKWREYCGYYKASGGEKFLSFGKFGNAPAVEVKELGMEPYFEVDVFQSKAYYQLDDVVVKSISESESCGCAENRPPPDEEEFAPGADLPPYLFALDASGSMKKDGLFDSLRINLVRFVRELPHGSPVSFVTFASSARTIFAGHVAENTPAVLDSLLKRSPIGGGTNVPLGLQVTYTSWPTEIPDSAKLVFISDGAFSVTEKIIAIVKKNFENYGRKLILIQIGAHATGLEQLEPYLDNYIHTTASELNQIVDQLNHENGSGGSALSCACEEEFSPVLNYHFVVDYSGSMVEEKSRAILAVQYLFERIPENAFISVTTFNTNARELYVGEKTGITMNQLSALLRTEQIGGGTDPTPGVKHALQLAERLAEDRFTHLILVTDLAPWLLSRKEELGKSMQESHQRFYLAGSSIEVSNEGMVTTNAQFDLASGNWIGVSRLKFERDLFKTMRSSCDYTSQTYHYSPSKTRLKGATKKLLFKLGRVFVENALAL